MALSPCLFGVLLLFPLTLQAQISFPLDNVTYWSTGSEVKLPWTCNVPKADIFGLEILFTKSGSSTVEILAESIRGANATSKDLSKFTIEGQATLVFKNANLGDNGTYTLAVTLRGGAGQQRSEVKVIILEQPIAQITCSDKNGSIYCMCKSDVGNPPPLACWSKDGLMIGDFGYKEKNLTVDNITKGEAAIYSCNVKSHNLTDQKNVSLVPSTANISCTGKGDSFSCLCKGIGGTPPARTSWFKNGRKIKGPGYLKTKLTKDDIKNGGEGVYYCNSLSGQLNNVTQITLSKILSENVDFEIDHSKPTSGDTVTITCYSKVNPTPDYILYRNGTVISSNGGVGDDIVKEKGAINYTCEARNIFGKVNKSVVIEVKVGTNGGGGGGGLGTGAIVGIIVAAIVVVGVVVGVGVVVYLCWKKNRRCLKRTDPEDQETSRKAAEAKDVAEPDSTSPPVYGVADKNKNEEKTSPQPTYAPLHPVAQQPDSSKMRDRSGQKNNYADNNMHSLQSDLV